MTKHDGGEGEGVLLFAGNRASTVYGFDAIGSGEIDGGRWIGGRIAQPD